MRWLRLRHPAQLMSTAFGAAILVGTLLLLLPMARAGPGGAPPGTALFTSVSAVCVIGLVVVDTPTYWTPFGQAVILALTQLGGFGIMTLASLLALLFSRRMGLRRRLVVQAETGAIRLGDIRRLLAGVAVTSLVVEAAAALVLAVRFAVGWDEPLGRAVWLGVFHAVSAFNNAGFSLFSDNLVRFVTDPWVSLTVVVAVVIGGLGVPVLLELRQGLAGRHWRLSLHSRLTLVVTAGLLVAGTLAMITFEWTNPRTLGPLSAPAKLLAALFQGTMPRSAGLNTVDIAGMNETTLLVSDVLMYIGAGSASTGGGIKVTTFAVIGLMIRAEVRGDPEVNVSGRRIPESAQRQALAVAALGLGLVVVGTLALMATGRGGLSASLFEATSAFGTTGLSTGLSQSLPPAGRAVLTVLMFLGRIGPITFAAALALREREQLFRYAEERPIIG